MNPPFSCGTHHRLPRRESIACKSPAMLSSKRMPTRRRPDPPPIEVRRFTPEQAAWAIQLLESRIADAKALETLRYDDPKVEVALHKIRGNIVEIFGENSREYREHQYYNISGGDSIAGVGWGEDSSYHEAQCQ